MPISWVGLKGVSPYSVRPRPTGSQDISVESSENAAPVKPVAEEPDGGRERRQRLVKAYARDRKQDSGVGALLAAKVMSAPVVTVQSKTPLPKARQLLDTHGFRNLPVLAPNKTLVGILCDRDLLRWGPDQKDAPTQVSELMSTRLLTATIDTPLRTIAKVMVDEQLSSLPIINSARHVVGILTLSDLMRCVVEHSLVDLWA